MDPVIARYGTTPEVMDQVWDQSLAFGPIDTHTARRLQIAFLHPDGSIDTDIPGALAGLYTLRPHRRHHRQHRDTSALLTVAGQVGKTMQVQGDILRFLAEPDTPPAGTLTGMSVGEVQRWIARHQQRLHTCTLTPTDLPRS